jgi:hypothetical protein
MAQQLSSINLVAPAFKGINTEDSPIAQDPSFADIADNAVIDKRGRIAARKGHNVLTTDKTALGTASIKNIHEFKDSSGAKVILSVGNNKVMTGTTTLTDITSSISISADNWKIVNFNDKAYFFQRGVQPLVYDGSTLSQLTGIASTQYGNEVISAYGRLWTADVGTNNKSIVYWSDLLIGNDWSGGTSGRIDISKVWPDGYDEIVALAAHNGFLIIFGQHSIVVYQGAEEPSTMSLSDTIAGVGCVDRDTVQYTGTDVIFLSHIGLRSFGRTIQEKSMPISTLSKTITKDIIKEIQGENTSFRSVYSPEENFYLLSFVGRNTTFCFDLRGTLEDGSYRVTRWPQSVFTAYERLEDGTLHIGSTEGIGTYSGYQDNGQSYRFKYYSPSLTFGDPSKLKFIKKIKPTIIGPSNATAFIKLAYDFSETYKNVTFTIPQATTVAEFNVSEFGANSNPLSQFSGESKQIVRKGLNGSGSGSTVVVGLESDINGSELSLQEINILALLGKTI